MTSLRIHVRGSEQPPFREWMNSAQDSNPVVRRILTLGHRRKSFCSREPLRTDDQMAVQCFGVYRNERRQHLLQCMERIRPALPPKTDIVPLPAIMQLALSVPESTDIAQLQTKLRAACEHVMSVRHAPQYQFPGGPKPYTRQ